MVTATRGATRVFKTSWFAKTARKAGIADVELCEAIVQVIDGHADDLGDGVFKKDLRSNRYRSVVLAKGGRHWIYTYLFAKQDRSNLDAAELKAFRALAEGYEALTTAQLAQLVTDTDLTEICHGEHAQV